MRWEGNTCLSHLTRSRQYPHFQSDQASKYSHEYGLCFRRKTPFSPLCSQQSLDVAALPTPLWFSSKAIGLFFAFASRYCYASLRLAMVIVWCVRWARITPPPLLGSADICKNKTTI